MHAADGIGVAESGNVCAVLWRRSVTRPRFHAQKSGLASVVARHPEGVGFLSPGECSRTVPRTEARGARVRERGGQ